MGRAARELAVVTGASSGIGYHLAIQCAKNNFDLIVAADEIEIQSAAEELRGWKVNVESVQADLATAKGVEKLVKAIGDRDVGALLANAGRGLGRAFLDQDMVAIQRVIDTNVTGTVYLIHHIARGMCRRGKGRILITGSIAGFMPGSYQAVYNGTKAFLNSFSWAIRNELQESGVTVTCLMPGATETEFFERADMLDTKVGQAKKDDAPGVAKVGFDAMMAGEGDVVSGWHNKLETAIASVTPASVLAERHRKEAAPGTGKSKG